jgi:hypothetical protein
MTEQDLEKLKYPTGKFVWDKFTDPAVMAKKIKIIAGTPAKFRAAASGLTEAQLNTPYRPEGWTLRQVIHHVPDSHLNAYIRTKLALTKDNPTVIAYSEKAWALTPDYEKSSVESSVRLLESVHERWIHILRSLKAEDFARPFIHPEYPTEPRNIGWIVSLYSWHGPHHIAHITGLRERMGW